MMTTINYKTKEPTVYNKGTEWETTCDTFLAYYTYKNIEDAKADVDELNNTHPTYTSKGEPIDWNKVAYFFVDEEEVLDTRDSF